MPQLSQLIVESGFVKIRQGKALRVCYTRVIEVVKREMLARITKGGGGLPLARPLVWQGPKPLYYDFLKTVARCVRYIEIMGF